MATPIQDYEMMLIFTPVLTEEEFKGAQNKLTTYITENGGEIVHQNAWGLRSLAYPIQKKTTGFYVVLEYKAPSNMNARLEVQLNRDETIMRHMVNRLDKYAVAYNDRKRNNIAHFEPKNKAEKTEDDASVSAS